MRLMRERAANKTCRQPLLLLRRPISSIQNPHTSYPKSIPRLKILLFKDITGAKCNDMKSTAIIAAMTLTPHQPTRKKLRTTTS